MLLSFVYNGRNYESFTPEDALAKGVPQSVIDEAIALQGSLQNKEKIRGQLNLNIGDTETLVGTATDAVHLCLYIGAKILGAINIASDLNELKEQVAEFLPLAGGVLDDIENGALKLPFLVKGMENVVEEIKARATQTAEILIAGQGD